ncbi:hypothetical protein Q7P36_002945 [Cladosporium allicinum]
MLRSLAQHAEDAGVGRKTIPASCTGAMCCERTPFACQPPCNAVYGLSARQQREGLLLLLRITSRPIPSVDAYEAPAAGTVPYPSTVHRAVGLSAAASCVLGSACGGLPHTTLGLPGGLAVGEGSELRKVHTLEVYILE